MDVIMSKMLLKLSGDEGDQLMNCLTDINSSLQNVVVAPGGPQGLKGDTGLQGVAGVQGIQGPPGNDGVDGTQGIQGLTGSQGIQGLQGLQGIQGLTGNDGNDGLNGADSTVAGPKGDRGDQGVPGSVANETNILSRLTTLEAYSPLVNNSVGVVSDITYINKNEIILPSEIISNGVFSNTGTQTDWTPSAIAHMWYDASDASTITITNNLVTEWKDKTSNGVDLVPGAGHEPVMGNLNFNGPDAIDFGITGSKYLSNTAVGTSSAAPNPVNIFSVAKYTVGGIRFNSSNTLTSTNNRVIMMGQHNRVDFYNLGNTDIYINGVNTGPTNTFTSVQSPAIINTEQTNTTNDVGFGLAKYHTRTDRGWKGVISEVVVLNTTVTAAERSKIEGYLAHKWNLSSILPSNHTYKNAKPIIGGVTVANWTVTSGSLNTTLLSTNDAIQSGTSSSLKITQTIVTTIDDVYELTINRSDTNTVSPLKIEFPLAVQNINTLSTALSFDVSHGSKLRFKVLDSTNFSITINTVDNLPVITSLEMNKVMLSEGTISESTNNTIFKLTGGSAWNAGTSSTEYINGQADGYVQFQLGRGDKDLKVGLVYSDVDYAEADPFEMSFIGSNIEIEGSSRTTYISGDYFRINHESTTNTIQYQKRDSSGVYQTFYIHSITTNGNHLFLDTSFYHEAGRLNDVFFLT
tara:strand:+ start:180 stop:2246 length:2067 start_codon:yes stop_codon:yes gene_type:complete